MMLRMLENSGVKLSFTEQHFYDTVAQVTGDNLSFSTQFLTMLNHSLQTITVECVLKASASRATVTLTDVHFNTSSVHVEYIVH